MPYRLNPAEPVAENVRRIAAEEIKSAIRHLQRKSSTQREKDTHEARKSIKRLRALLRLLRPAFGPSYRQENAALRAIGQSLSDLRDSSIVLETLDVLTDEPIDRAKLQPVRTGLRRWKKASDKTVDTEKTLHEAATSLAVVAERISAWPLSSDGFDAVKAGLKAEYRAGRKAMTKAFRNNDSLLFHEWRKRAKCQLFHLRLLKCCLNEPLQHLETRLHELETALGDDHNLLILRQHLDKHSPALGGKGSVQESLRLVAKREHKLRTEAQALGEKIYAQTPRQFVAELRTEWKKAHRVGPTAAKKTRQRHLRKEATAA